MPGADRCERDRGERPVAGHQTLAFDPAGAKACLDAYAQAPCDKAGSYCLSGVQRYEAWQGLGGPGTALYDATHVDVGWAGLACSGVLAPTVVAGGACSSGSSCARGVCTAAGPGPYPPDACSPAYVPPGSPCSPDTPPPLMCSCAPTTDGGHLCVTGPTAGEACAYAEGACETYLSCIPGAPDGSTGTQANGHCGAPGGAGDACSGRLYEIDCKPGLYCTPAGICGARLAEGAPCTTPFACDDGLLCVGLELQLPSTVDPPQYVVTNDGPVTVVAPGTCARPLGVGQACTPLADPAGTYGIGADGCAFFESACTAAHQCVAYAPSGAGCSGGAQPGCGPFSSCNPNTNTCF